MGGVSLTPLDLGVEWLPSPSARKLVPEGCPRGPGDTWSSLPFVERGERLPPGTRQSLPGPSRWSVQTGPFLLRSSSASCSCWAHSPHRLPQTLHCCRGRLPHAVPRHILGLTSPLQSLLTFFSPFCPLATPPPCSPPAPMGRAAAWPAVTQSYFSPPECPAQQCPTPRLIH